MAALLPRLGRLRFDHPLLLLHFVEQHGRQDVVADASGLAVLVEHHQFGVDLRHLLGDQPVLDRARPVAGSAL